MDKQDKRETPTDDDAAVSDEARQLAERLGVSPEEAEMILAMDRGEYHGDVVLPDGSVPDSDADDDSSTD